MLIKLFIIEGVLNQIYRAAKPGGQPIKEYTVTGSGPYEITMAPYKCGNNFDKFKITDAQVNISDLQVKISDLQVIISHLHVKISDSQVKISDSQVKFSNLQVICFCRHICVIAATDTLEKPINRYMKQ